MKDRKKENKICCILHSFSSFLFTASGITLLVTKGIIEWTGITNIALGITFGSLAYIYYKKYKEEK